MFRFILLTFFEENFAGKSGETFAFGRWFGEHSASAKGLTCWTYNGGFKDDVGKNDKDIMSLIGCYTPVYRDCQDQAIEMMNKISTGWTERKKKFIKAINFVRCGEIEKRKRT